MARPLKPFVRGGGYYPSAKYTPLVYPGGYTTLNAKNGKPEPLNTFVGKIVQFLAKRSLPTVKLEATLEPIQDLHGYENPWPSGGGKNLFHTTLTSGTASGLTYTVNSDGTITLTNSPSALVEKTIGTINLTAGVSYKINGCSFSSASCRLQLKSGSTAVKQAYNNQDQEYTPETTGEYTVTFVCTSGTSPNITLYPMIRLASVQDATFAPYSNECPISGHTGTEVYVEDEYDAQATPTAEIAFGQTVYGGTLTVNEDGSGSIKARPYYASYNGEALVGPWVSSMDAYAPGATPTTGAQVVDMGGTEITIPLTASQINTLVGTNTVWVNDATGDITVQAYGTAIT